MNPSTSEVAAALAALKSPKLNSVRRKIEPFEEDQIDAVGSVFYFKEASGPFLVSVDDGPDFPWDVGTGLKAEQGAIFKKLTIKNPTSQPLIIVVVIGLGEVLDNRFTLVPSRDFAVPTMEAASVAIAKGEVPGIFVGGVLAAGTHLDFPGVFALPLMSRKAIYVSNKHPNDYLSLLDADGLELLAIEPKSSSQYPVSGFVRVACSGGNPVACAISEIVYKRPEL